VRAGAIAKCKIEGDFSSKIAFTKDVCLPPFRVLFTDIYDNFVSPDGPCRVQIESEVLEVVGKSNEMFNVSMFLNLHEVNFEV
jgi:hypothetical protein